MLGISYRHEVMADDSIVLADYRYADDEYPEQVMCEAVNGMLIWHKTPDEFVRAVVEDEFRKVQSEWFLEYNGIKKVFDVPRMSFDEWAAHEGGWL